MEVLEQQRSMRCYYIIQMGGNSVLRMHSRGIQGSLSKHTTLCLTQLNTGKKKTVQINLFKIFNNLCNFHDSKLHSADAFVQSNLHVTYITFYLKYR